MRRAVVAVAILLSFPISAQVEKHAPTVDVCRADLAVWGDLDLRTDYFNAEAESIKNHVSSRNEIHKLSIKEVRGRMLEMYQCAKVDPDRKVPYSEAGNFYAHVQSERMLHFIVRHNLQAQFDQEDAAGKR